MVAMIVSTGSKIILWCLAAAGLLGLVLAGMIASPLRAPPELTSISRTAGAVDRSTMPGLERFNARDGTELAYRHYPARATGSGQIAVLVHGSSGSSLAVHALAKGLAERGVETWAPDIRGHGASGTRGDIGYVGQLEDDLSDFVGLIRKASPAAPLTLIGHSAGGGFALRVAGSSIQNQFVRTVLLAPYLGYAAPTNRPNSGGWASADIPRIIALSLLHRIGLECCDALPVVAFAVPRNSGKILVPAYTERLRGNFGAHRDFQTDLAAATKPVIIYSGADDELMLSDKYADAVRAVRPGVDVRLIDGVNHMGIASDPATVSVIADDLVKAGSSS